MNQLSKLDIDAREVLWYAFGEEQEEGVEGVDPFFVALLEDRARKLDR